MQVPSVSVSAACFSHNSYRGEAAANCISNLLAVDFKRLYLDLHWDTQQLRWSLCPAELPLPPANVQPSVSTTAAETSTHVTSAAQSKRAATASSKYGFEKKQGTAPDEEHDEAVWIGRRQAGGSTSTASSSAAASTTTSPAQQPTGEQGSDSQQFQIGPYSCDRDASLSMFMMVLQSYLLATDNTIQASFKHIIFDLHIASPVHDPTAPGERPPSDRLPNGSNLVGPIIDSNLSTWFYTPPTLLAQRADLNTSWSAAPGQESPDPAYFINDTSPGRASFSPDGWPSEGFLEFFKNFRLILGYGSIDPQLSDYDFQRDQTYIFAPDFLSRGVDDTISSDGDVTSGCIFDSASSSVSSANSSWALSPLGPSDLSTSPVEGRNSSPTYSYTAAHALIDCGISPHLNATLSDTTADVDPAPYLAFTLSTVWSWAPGQPLNDSAASSHSFPGMDDGDYAASDFRCAYFNGSQNVSPTEGRWYNTFCQNELHAACRDNNNPYSWSVSDRRGRHNNVADNCPMNTTFAVPRTSLENRYLLTAVQSFFSSPARAPSRMSDDRERAGAYNVWLNFNSIDVEACWVSGPDARCPYTNTTGQNEGQVVVPIVAAFAIIILAFLTVLAKLGGNRRKSRKRRRVKEGWEYEGVPS